MGEKNVIERLKDIIRTKAAIKNLLKCRQIQFLRLSMRYTEAERFLMTS